MLGEHHDLAHEFPEYKERIHDLKMSDLHFAKLYQEYEKLDKEIYRIEQQIETPSDEYTEQLKKKRALLKDKLYALLKSP
ncbi:MAG: DUF465 domain-containing protein [Gammaproteobacteria bacterium]|nr:DUF465 domain-containing protein [Gammaproteobacteria bacterium]